jgi:hypothetical protein
MTFSIALSKSKRARPATSRRSASVSRNKVPPEHHVEKISRKLTSKLKDANCSVRAPRERVERCHSSRLVSERCARPMPFGCPVEPEV